MGNLLNYAVADLRDVPSPSPIFFHFNAVFDKIYHPSGLCSQSLGNPVLATVYKWTILCYILYKVEIENNKSIIKLDQILLNQQNMFAFCSTLFA